MILPQGDDLADEFQQFSIFRSLAPIYPANVIVLAVTVVVSLLSVADCISCQQHWHTLRKKQSCEEVTLLLCAQGVHRSILSNALSATIPTSIIVSAVAVPFSIRLVVLFVIADEVLKGEPIMRGDKIYTGVRAPPTTGIKVAGTGDPICEFPYLPAVPLPVRSNHIAITIVPLRPSHGKFSDLIPALS